MSEHFNKVQDDELNKSDEQPIERSENIDVRKELEMLRKKVKDGRFKMNPEEREHYFNAIRNLNNKLEE